VSDATLRKDLWKIIGVICALSVLSIAAVLVLTEQALTTQSREILDQKENTVRALAGRLQLRFEDATKVLKVASESTEFEKVNNAASVSEYYNGIPIGVEEGKRKILRDLRENYGTFDTVHFMLPNGDIYILEPYDRQLILPRLNFADREYYQGATATGNPYASDVIISTASMHRVAPIAVPVQSSDGTLNGLIVGATDLGQLEEQLRKELNLSNNNRVIFVDGKGNAIEDVSEGESETYTTIESLTHLKSVQNVIAGQSGNLIEYTDGRETLAVYHPATINDRSWGVVLMQPTTDAYASINYLRNQVYVMLAIIVSIIAASGYFLLSFRTHSTLSKQLGKANVELIKKDKLKDEFLKIASHELRTPIQPIIGYAALGARGLLKGDEAWKVVHKEAQRLMRLANNIVDISMVQSGVITYNMEATHIAEVVRKAVESFKPMVQEKKLSLDLEVDDQSESIEINVDVARLKGVFGELLDNAIKFTEKGGIRVECITEADKLLIRFSDTGSSIPAALFPKIFDKFSSKSVDDPTIQGAGLGLYICKAIISAHGGTIVARNNTEGPGAVFEVSLPLQSRQEYAPKPTAAAN
jgi:signal transduction histidine kinase